MNNNDDTKLGDAFKKGGVFADNIRITIDDGGDKELRESMKAHGWVEQFPALVDEHDMTLVGHRRLKIAAELGIAPVIQKLVIGLGDEADAKRLRLAIVSNVGFKPMTKEDRQRITKYLYGGREWTMQRIADALGVSKKTVSVDLSEIVTEGNNSKPAKTASNPKGAGRPKGRKEPPKRHYRADEVIALHDNGMKQSEVAEATGIHPRMVRKMVEHENLRRSGQPQVTPEMLSMSQREKCERWLEQEKKRLGKDFWLHVEQRVSERLNLALSGVRERLEEQRKLSEGIIKRRDGFIKKRTWNLIVTCLHPDKFDHIVSLVNDGKTEELSQLKSRYSDAFRMFKQFEKLVLDEKESPTSFAPPLPKTSAEWDAAGVAAKAARKEARRNANNAKTIRKK